MRRERNLNIRHEKRLDAHNIFLQLRETDAAPGVDAESATEEDVGFAGDGEHGAEVVCVGVEVAAEVVVVHGGGAPGAEAGEHVEHDDAEGPDVVVGGGVGACCVFLTCDGFWREENRQQVPNGEEDGKFCIPGLM